MNFNSYGHVIVYASNSKRTTAAGGEKKNSRKHKWGFIPWNDAGRRRGEPGRYVFVLVLLFTQTSGLNGGFCNLLLKKGSPSQQPGVLIWVPLEQQLDLLDAMVISLSYNNKCFPFSSLTIQLAYICACCTRSRCMAIVKASTIQLHLNGFWPRCERDKETPVANTKAKKVGLRHSSRLGPTLLSRSFHIKFPVK